MIRLDIHETGELQNVSDKITQSFGNEIQSEYKCELGPDEGCKKLGTCTKSSQIIKLEDVVTIQLKIFGCDLSGNQLKIFPKIMRYRMTKLMK